MAYELKMPQLSDTMRSGKILRWNKQEGDAVAQGEVLTEVETDKANLEIESAAQGTLLKIMVAVGEEAKVGGVIAYIGQAGEPLPDKEAEAPAAAIPEQPQLSASGVKASPLARKIAAEHNIDLSRIPGSGPDGRIVREDVERAVSGGGPVLSAPEMPRPAALQPAPVSGVPGKLVPFSKMRAAIAMRMQESASEAPHFFTTAAVDMEAAKDLRETLKKKPEFKGLGINHFIIKAAAYALAREPRINCAPRGDHIFIPDQINIGVVTAVEDGLLIPVIKQVDKLALKDVASEARAAVERAKSGKPNAADLSGGTFTISNMGMYDIENFTAIINPGQGAILSVSAMREEAVVRKGQLAVGLMMRVTLAVDHRVIDGIMSAQYLGHFKEALETPALLLL